MGSVITVRASPVVAMIKRQLLSRASVKRELRRRPAENRVANLTPPRFSRYFSTTMPGLSPVASRSATCRSPSDSTLRAITRPVREYQLFSRPVRSDCHVSCTSTPGQRNTSDRVIDEWRSPLRMEAQNQGLGRSAKAQSSANLYAVTNEPFPATSQGGAIISTSPDDVPPGDDTE